MAFDAEAVLVENKNDVEETRDIFYVLSHVQFVGDQSDHLEKTDANEEKQEPTSLR